MYISPPTTPLVELETPLDLPFPFPCIISLDWLIFGAPQHHYWEKQTYVFTQFFVVILIFHNFCLTYFLLQSVLLTVFRTKVNLLSLLPTNILNTYVAFS